MPGLRPAKFGPRIDFPETGRKAYSPEFNPFLKFGSPPENFGDYKTESQFVHDRYGLFKNSEAEFSRMFTLSEKVQKHFLAAKISSRGQNQFWKSSVLAGSPLEAGTGVLTGSRAVPCSPCGECQGRGHVTWN